MSEVDLLFVVLAAFYAWESSCWVQRGGVLFRTWLGRRWTAVHPGNLLGNARAGLVFAPPLPPLGHVHGAHQLPFSLSPEVLLAYTSTSINPGSRPPQLARLWQWENLKPIAAHARSVRSGNEALLRAESSALAQTWATRLEEVRRAPRGERAEVIRAWFESSFDARAIEARIREGRLATQTVRGVGNALFIALFLVTPGMVHLIGFPRCWLPALLVVVALTLTTAFLFCRAHRRLYPSAADDRFTHTLSIALFPPSAVRAHDALTRPLLAGFHPLALAVHLLRPDRARGFATLVLTELRHPARPVCPSEDERMVATESWSRRLLTEVVEALLARNELVPAELLAPPLSEGPGCRRYCPRCRSQYTDAVGVCADCGGLPLAELPMATPLP